MIDLHKLLTEADRVLRIAEAHALKSGLSMLKPGLGRQPHEHPGNDFALPHETRTFAWTFSDPLPQPHRPEVAGGDSSVVAALGRRGWPRHDRDVRAGRFVAHRRPRPFRRDRLAARHAHHDPRAAAPARSDVLGASVHSYTISPGGHVA